MNRVKRQQIVNISIDLFAKLGIANVSIVRISKELGASTGMIYHYFKNGKEDIIAEILQIFEDCVRNNVPDEEDWKSKEANEHEILASLFFEFPAADALRLRKIVRIIMSEMYFNKQIEQHAANHLITGREKVLANCFTTLADAGKIPPLDAESAARCLNRLIVAYAIEDALRYPFADDKAKSDEQTIRMIRDCTNIINSIITKRFTPRQINP